MNARGPNAAVNAAGGDVPRPGTIHITPPDQHMRLEGPVPFMISYKSLNRFFTRLLNA
ncbi:hypothetical protein [Polaromonas glacialis]|uniref:hypothetical protein n=1 Tax=Polaromonas glacialis TaxID=866564 RepID=UPI000ADA42CB|nr:hypothetical protein [Polaromonas glacialis]